MIGALIIGLVAGIIAGKLMGSEYPWYIDIILGLVGASIGGFIYSLIFQVPFTSGFDLTSLIVSVVGAVIVIALYRMITKRRV